MTHNQDDREDESRPGEVENPVSTSPGELESRISALVAEFGSRVNASKVAGVSTDQLSRYEAGTTAPRMEPIARMCAAKGWSLDYLWWGRHTMAAPSVVADSQAAYRNTDFVYIPRYDVEAAAGDGASIAEERIVGRYAFRRSWIRTKGWDPANLALIQARGDSQEGLIDDGQLVLVNLADDNVRREGIFVLRLDDHLVIKIVQVDHRGTLYIRSNNPAYREIAVPANQVDELNVVGRAVWTDRLL